MAPEEVKEFLLEKAERYEVPDFIPQDPLSIPHRFTDRRDVEVASFFAASLAWGNRVSILKSLESLMERMDHAPGSFVMDHEESDLKVFEGFVHRTFQEVDAKGFVQALAGLLRTHGSLEQAMMSGWETPEDPACLASALTSFHRAFMAQEGVALRTQKHVANPAKGSAAKRLNMWLRWMVRPANRGVDLGLWKGISPSVLHIPLDVHTSNVGRKLGLLTRTANDWKAVAELTASLRAIDPVDPVRLDFALFGLGAIEGF
ncbi:MAG: TIGR02757 family protein [Bacteroidota bacterium]|nr:TIGR02757 family protein [Bacteroidota bacterium]HBS19392.1 TIGR02757 family protein [Flavobacteriales bacterium]MEC7949782.1 TIGR02757 family protein [Bacteroidota bacterium]MEC8368227.1 TIGR02757 family protein [Bacteroidota bacterium]MEC8400215.1 TIGR02757 family protein [Bacteroidota bacterium]|tara:strand:- start:295 stop:1074 length:780 start_codon:yes stop_codon:yes gene_type:complete